MSLETVKPQKVWIRKFGAAQVLSLEDTPVINEHVQAGKVQVDIHYSGVNFADIIMRLGFYPDAPAKPFVPGYEFSGVVKAVGEGVTKFKVGDEVYGGCVFGAYSSELTISAWMLLKVPEHLNLQQAAALPVAFITNHAALIDMGRIRPGDEVLIDCATGGLGTIALQMLKALGANVTGLTSSQDKKEFIESYGAKAYTHSEFAKRKDLNQYDFILNSQGGKSIREHYDRLGFTGRIVCLGISSGINNGKRDFFSIIKAAMQMPKFSIIKMFDKNRGVYALNALKLMEDEAYGRKHINDFQKISEWKIVPHVGGVFSKDEVSKAHKLIEQRKAKGKVLIKWK